MVVRDQSLSNTKTKRLRVKIKPASKISPISHSDKSILDILDVVSSSAISTVAIGYKHDQSMY